MKNLLIGINAKYIHPNLAIRLLKKNTKYPVEIKEFTIKDNKYDIVNYIISNQYTTVGFSCYIWNIEIIKEILNDLKNKNITIILGGPEVSYNASYYIKNNLASYVIKNEGEEAYNLLLKHLDNKYNLEDVPNLYYKDNFTFDKLVDLNNAEMAYDLLDDLNNKIIYLETSRGCPYKCGYCMASLDNKVRYFNIETIKEQILTLLKKGAKIFKFLDRTFNANKNNFINLIDFIIEKHLPNTSFQFEITGDLLSTDIIEYINIKAPKNLFRFEIGIQSTNIKSNLSVGRIQNNEKLFNNIMLIQKGNVIDLHLDLIAGLPYEDYNSFVNTFNEVVKLKPKELQLGFLKLLRGTRLFDEQKQYGYIYSTKAPYEIIKNNFMNEKDIKNIHITEDAFESYYNKGIMRNSMSYILDNEDNIYNFFHKLGQLDYKGKGLENTFRVINDYLENKNYYHEIHKLLIIDYLSYYNVKPKAWWNETCLKKDRNEIIRQLHDKNILSLSLNDLYKYSLVINLKDDYIVAIYKEGYKKIHIIKKEELN